MCFHSLLMCRDWQLVKFWCLGINHWHVQLTSLARGLDTQHTTTPVAKLVKILAWWVLHFHLRDLTRDFELDKILGWWFTLHYCQLRDMTRGFDTLYTTTSAAKLVKILTRWFILWHVRLRDLAWGIDASVLTNFPVLLERLTFSLFLLSSRFLHTLVL